MDHPKDSRGRKLTTYDAILSSEAFNATRLEQLKKLYYTKRYRTPERSDGNIYPEQPHHHMTLRGKHEPSAVDFWAARDKLGWQQAKKQLDALFKQEPPPTLKDIKHIGTVGEATLRRNNIKTVEGVARLSVAKLQQLGIRNAAKILEQAKKMEDKRNVQRKTALTEAQRKLSCIDAFLNKKIKEIPPFMRVYVDIT